MNTKALEHSVKKILTRQELLDLLSLPAGDLHGTYSCIRDLEEQGMLRPVRNSGTNGNRQYPLYARYRITARPDYTKEMEEIRTLNPILSGNGYLIRHPEEYAKQKERILALNRWLFRHDSDMEISRKERSYEIFGQEKVLDDKEMKSLLRKLGIDQKILHFYDTPEYCFSDYILHPGKDMHLLICENKDIWFDIRRLMFEDKTDQIFGTRFDGVVYGSGEKAAGRDGSLEKYIHLAGYDDVRFSYWGDIDRAGLEIYLGAVRYNPDLSISLFTPAYHAMLERAEGRENESSKDQRRHDLSAYEAIYALFDETDAQRMRQMIEENRLIPQEIISYRVLKEECKTC